MIDSNAKRDIISEILKNVKMQDAGVKSSKLYDYPLMGCGKSEKDKTIYPTLRLDIQQAPGLSGYDTEDKVTLVIEATIISHDIRSSLESNKENFEVEINKIGCYGKKDEDKE